MQVKGGEAVESMSKRKLPFRETGTERGHLRGNWNEKGPRISAARRI